MSNNPYRDGFRSYQNGYSNNPYIDTFKQGEWQRGYDYAETADQAERNSKSDRWNSLWNVPERARDSYIEMEDSFNSYTVCEFMKSMIGEE